MSDKRNGQLVLNRTRPHIHTLRIMNTELSDNFILLPQDEWLKKHCEILRDSMALDGTALPKRLVQQAVHSIQSRNQIPIQEIEMQYLTEHIHTRLPKLGLPDHPAAARKAESRSTDALQEQVNYYINQVDGGAPRYNTEPSLSSSRAVSFDNLEDIEKFLLASDHDFGQAERMELDEEEDISNSGAAESEVCSHLFLSPRGVCSTISEP